MGGLVWRKGLKEDYQDLLVRLSLGNYVWDELMSKVWLKDARNGFCTLRRMQEKRQ